MDNNSDLKVTNKAIGKLGEKSLHAFLKNYLEPNQVCHEVKINGKYADILNENGVFEIQTRQLYKLKNKLDIFLNEYNVTVVYPVAHTKYLYWINKENGEITEKRKSPKTGRAIEVFKELYSLKGYITNKRFSLMIILCDVDEYRYLDGWSKDKKKGSNRCDRIPNNVHCKLLFSKPKDYLYFVPDDMESEFTVKSFAKAAKVNERTAGLVLNVLCSIGVIEKTKKIKNAFVYEISKKI